MQAFPNANSVLDDDAVTIASTQITPGYMTNFESESDSDSDCGTDLSSSDDRASSWMRSASAPSCQPQSAQTLPRFAQQPCTSMSRPVPRRAFTDKHLPSFSTKAETSDSDAEERSLRRFIESRYNGRGAITRIARPGSSSAELSAESEDEDPWLKERVRCDTADFFQDQPEPADDNRGTFGSCSGEPSGIWSQAALPLAVPAELPKGLEAPPTTRNAWTVEEDPWMQERQCCHWEPEEPRMPLAPVARRPTRLAPLPSAARRALMGSNVCALEPRAPSPFTRSRAPPSVRNQRHRRVVGALSASTSSGDSIPAQER
mmetsp:Transcript_11150/g.25405  ORF Transcript_11150/g.25405 Transcript_11150/m.25405 type:complete len:317 (+) Transcript_11150:90-1040(+)